MSDVKPTRVSLIATFEGGRSFRFWEVSQNKDFTVSSFIDGVLVIIPSRGTTINEIVELAVGSFHEESNMALKVNEAFFPNADKPLVPIESITFIFNGVKITVTSETTIEKALEQLVEGFRIYSSGKN